MLLETRPTRYDRLSLLKALLPVTSKEWFATFFWLLQIIGVVALVGAEKVSSKRARQTNLVLIFAGKAIKIFLRARLPMFFTGTRLQPTFCC